MKTKTTILLSIISILFYIGCEPGGEHHHESMGSGPAAAGSVYDLDLAFADAAGGVFQFDELAGNPVVLSLIFTRCESVCPMQASNMLRIQRALDPEDQERVRFVIVSFDEADRAEDLTDFGKKMRLEKHWTLLGGDPGAPEAVRELAAALGFQYRRNAAGGFSHSAAIYLLNERGEIVHTKEGTGQSTQDFVQHLDHL
ncbi:MAG: SCO family protein [Leptospirales bacterium]